MKTEHTFALNGMFKILSTSKEDLDNKLSGVTRSIESMLNDLEFRGIINSYGREHTGTGGWCIYTEKVKEQEVNI